MVRGAIMTSPCPSTVRAIPSMINSPHRNGHDLRPGQTTCADEVIPKLPGIASIVGSAVRPEDSIPGRSRQHVRPNRKVQRPELYPTKTRRRRHVWCVANFFTNIWKDNSSNRAARSAYA